MIKLTRVRGIKSDWKAVNLHARTEGTPTPLDDFLDLIEGRAAKRQRIRSR
jgi:hypothetical protein